MRYRAHVFSRQTVNILANRHLAYYHSGNMSIHNCNNTNMDLENWFKTVKQFVLEAGQVVAEGFSSNKDVEMKAGAWDLVTQYDKKVEKILIEQIATTYPTHKMIGEETSDKNTQLTNDPTWLIDPIDGTMNFVHSNPHTCISVALAVNKRLEIGIVYNPILKHMFTAQRGCGAYLNDKPIRVSKVEDISEALLGFEISMARAPSVRDLFISRFNAILCRAHGVRTMGSAALSLCYVAMGAWDGYQVDHLWCWDYSAGALIIKEAGGVVIDTSGDEFQIMNQKILTASTPQLAQQIVKLIKNADASLASKSNCHNNH